MTKKTHAGSFQAQSEEFIREEALRIARATQAPGQNKEQTKLIAKGIAKGIAEYRKEEKIKQRERARLRKKRKSAENTPLPQDCGAEPVSGPLIPGIDRFPGLTAAGIFLLAGLLHLLRLVLRTEITIGSFPVPVSWSGAIGVASLVLTVWIYRSTQASVRIARKPDPE
ncbi:MAG: DUF2956 domain-containing protein [Methylococcaceae bacterium]|nr:DUF2956 domain-containing protein [Methylococcaceae bacterium]